MPRLTRKVFNDLAIWMLVFGLFTGLLFPFSLPLLGFSREIAFRPEVFLVTLLAGALVAAINYLLVYWVVKPRLRLLVEHMDTTRSLVRDAAFNPDDEQCNTDQCFIPHDSDDEIGATALAFNDLVGELIRTRRMDQAASAFSKALSSTLELDDLSRQALELLLLHTSASAGLILVEREGELHLAANSGIQQPETVARSNLLREAQRQGRIQQMDMPEDLLVEGVLTSFRPRQVLVVPVQFKGQRLALVVLASPGQFSSDVHWLLELVGQGMGLAFNNALTHSQLQRTAALDALTGTYNRRFGQQRLHEELQRAKRSQSPLGVIMLDIDHFKQVNDTYGHQVGDRVLVKTVQAMRRGLRDGDVLVRYGGEEFLVLLPGGSREDATATAERIRHLVAETSIQDGDQTLHVTASLGCTAYPGDPSQDEQGLIRHADEMLYMAKGAGRNQVRCYNPTTPFKTGT